MDEILRRGIHALMKLPWMVSTTEAIEIHRLMAEVLQARSFQINWIIYAVYYDDGSPLMTSVMKHLIKISENRETATQALTLTSGALTAALDNPLDRVNIYQITYREMEENDEGDLYHAQPRLIRTRFSLDEMPIPGATYSLRIRENV